MSVDTCDKVLSIISNIQEGQGILVEETVEESADESEVMSKKSYDGKKTKEIRGMPKSGRFWKSKKDRFGTINKTKGLKQDFQQKTALRLELKRTKELSKQKQEELKLKEEARKERRRDNIKKAEENRKKSEIVQVITNTAKIKRMKKKQLRFIQKRDTNKEFEASK